jgi:conjugal transfer/entry exclusion protein
MRLRRILARRHLLAAALAAAAAYLRKPKSARADFWGGDIPILVGILTQAVATVSNLASMLVNLKEQLDAMNTMLSALDAASFQSVLALIGNSDLSYAQLTDNVASIGYTLQSVQSQFRGLYASDYRKLSFGQFDSLYGRWEDEILASAEVAARSQTTLSTLQSNATQAAAILEKASVASGEVAQLQSIAQMLGVMQSQNNSLLQSLATTGRVLTSSAAKSAAERQLSREKKRRQLANYTSRGAPVPPMSMP